LLIRKRSSRGGHAQGGKMRKLIIALVVFCPFPPAWAINLGAAIDDVSVVSIEVIDELKLTDSKAPRITSSGLLLMVKLSTSINLAWERNRWDYHIINNIYVCDQGIVDERKRILNDSSVYDDNGAVDDYLVDNTDLFYNRNNMKYQSNAKDGKYEYKIYFGVEQKRNIFRVDDSYATGSPPPGVHAEPLYFQYDLQSEPRDTCFQIHGSRWLSFWSFTSNTVLIPKERLIDAMSRAGLLKPKKR
jgi:hypothetical protein